MRPSPRKILQLVSVKHPSLDIQPNPIDRPAGVFGIREKIQSQKILSVSCGGICLLSQFNIIFVHVDDNDELHYQSYIATSPAHVRPQAHAPGFRVGLRDLEWRLKLPNFDFVRARLLVGVRALGCFDGQLPPRPRDSKAKTFFLLPLGGCGASCQVSALECFLQRVSYYWILQRRPSTELRLRMGWGSLVLIWDLDLGWRGSGLRRGRLSGAAA
ncbi:hypothetical protein M422DRAFT_238948 [Sphaerobolus stellatus SS14]|nr:hypothetical protein M422DRAFT_238948 [Sphaerobolus stellatus SS14]